MQFKGTHIHRQCTHTEDWDFRGTCGARTAWCPLNFGVTQLPAASDLSRKTCPSASGAAEGRRAAASLSASTAGRRVWGHTDLSCRHEDEKFSSAMRGVRGITSPGRGASSPCPGPDSQPLPHSSHGDALAQ